MSSALEPGAGAAVTGLFLGSLAIAGAVALVTAPITPRMAVAQTAAGPDAEPTAARLPGGSAVLPDHLGFGLDRRASGYRRDAVRD